MSSVCLVCGNASFIDGGDGFLYCNRCNSQADDYIETGIDGDEIYGTEGQAIYSNKHARQLTLEELRQSEKSKMVEDAGECGGTDAVNGDGPTGPSDFASTQRNLSYDDYYSEIRYRYVKGLQIMIQLQVKALVERFNVSPLIVGMVGPIWLRFLAISRIMADQWADDVIHESESQKQGEATTFEPLPKYRMEPHSMFGQRAVMIWLRSLISTIPLSYSLAISFLVSHLARESILPTDIVKWAVEGKLPYFAAFVEIEKQLGPPSSACPISSSRMFRPCKIVPLQNLEAFAASIAQKIGLELPQVNFHGIASRFLVELSIPVHNILRQACRIYEWSMPKDLFILDNKLRLPTRVCVMAILIVTIRILYDINGWGMWEMSLLTSRSSSSADGIKKPVNSTFAADDSAENFSSLYENASGVEDLELDAIALLKILETKYSEIKDTHDYSEDLQSYLKYCKDVVFAGSSGPFQDHEEEKIIQDLWDFYQEKSVKQPKDQEMNSQPLRDEAIRQLKLDMEESRFSYIPPRQQQITKMGYITYQRRRTEGSLVYACHADYYILLRACARVAQVDLRVMHLGVMKFERELRQLEKRINGCFKAKCNSPLNEPEENQMDG